ncbi:DNA-3-methyladenine glycosylase [Rubripirellula amarantea]|uniref:DNA-3-methyladenine glycosylase II n=1 Tax=Rubripirellula amarantea TaxID=2527999 RepID=A0A5C5WFM8_9BACT|nr:DNA-3-methyladenine glycosylase 2 family protein [Rubripirellula amarantea]TWT49337.1 DNA-3-methyladenine glycosylase [Rubripirellula amarantea]
MSIETLDKQAVASAAKTLARRDPNLAKVLRQHGPPPLWKRPATLSTFVRIILEQQVSLASAKSTFDKFCTACNDNVTPQAIIEVGDAGLRGIGFSRQKARYSLSLAEDVAERRFQIGRLRHLSDEAVRQQITSRLGMGDWTADVFLIMGLLRPDVFPIGDLALVNGIKTIDAVAYADRQAILDRAESWRPYRSVATRMIWQDYLSRRK